ncbi:MAG: LAGLIDADG family homing endonuclease [Candidatus Nanoarchaeia archaeon]|nr:LAGLIDADG family homing endonuclease [Candidatus Nanoarchaeia archaeon]
MEKIGFKGLIKYKIYIKLDKEAVVLILNIIKKSGLLLDEETKENLYRLSKNKKISLKFMKRLSILLEIPYSYFYKHTLLITSVKNTNIGIRNPKLPFNLGNVSGARFIGSIMGDGEINSQIQVRYNNQNKELIKKIIDCAKDLFGDVDYKLYLRKDKTYQLHFPKIVGLIMIEVGLKQGYKSENKYEIPDFIFKKNEKIKSALIRQFFNDEGNVRIKDRRLQVKQTSNIQVSKRICRERSKELAHKFLIGIKELLKSLGIDSNISLGAYRDKKADWELSVYGKENLVLYKKKIGFDLYEKTKKLDDAIKSYKFPSAPRNKKLEFAIKKFKQVEKINGYVTKYLLAKESKRSLKTAVYYLVDLKKINKIKEVEKAKDKKGHFLPRKYKSV